MKSNFGRGELGGRLHGCSASASVFYLLAVGPAAQSVADDGVYLVHGPAFAQLILPSRAAHV